MPRSYSGCACSAGASGNSDWAAPSWDQLDRRGNQPLGPGLGRSPYPALAGQLPHSAFRDAQPSGGLTHRDVGDIFGRRFRRQLELDRGRLLQRAHLVDQEADDLAVVVQPLEDALIVGGGEVPLPERPQHLEHVPFVVVPDGHPSARHGHSPLILRSRYAVRMKESLLPLFTTRQT